MQMLNTRQVAERLGCSILKVQNRIKSGKLPAVNTSAGNSKPRWSVRLQDLDEYKTPNSFYEAKAIAKTRTRQRIDAHITNKVFG